MKTTTKTNTTVSATPNIGGKVHTYSWTWERQQFNITYEVLGEGTPVLLLPAFSTVSTRGEMREIAQQIASNYQAITKSGAQSAIALDWIGFGDSDRPPLDYRRQIYASLLEDFVQDVLSSPTAVIAAGHASGYIMELANKMPASFTKIALVAPTWRGPFTVMGAPSGISEMVREAVRSPILGDTLYYLNTTPAFLKFMYEQHVYTDEAILTSEFVDKKREITQKPGAKYAPAAFVTGRLDPVTTQEQFLSYFQPCPVPVMVIIGEKCPSASKKEMEAISQCSGVETRHLPGSLGLHEECAHAVADEVLAFLSSD